MRDEHLCILNEKSKYEKTMRDAVKNPAVIYGINGDEREVQAYCYPADKWSVKEASLHASRRDGEFIAADGYSEDADFELVPIKLFEDAVSVESGKIEVDEDLEIFTEFLPEFGESVNAKYSLQLIPESDEVSLSSRVEEGTHVVSLQMSDNETYLEGVLEEIGGVDGPAVCEKCLTNSPDKAEFTYQTQVTGITDDRQIRKTYNGHGKIRWKAEVNGEEVVFGLSFPPKRLEEKDPLISAIKDEPVRVSQIRPPQSLEWFEKEGMVEKGEDGASKNRLTLYIEEDRGTVDFIFHEQGCHEMIFDGERINGRWVLEYVPGNRSYEWILTRTG